MTTTLCLTLSYRVETGPSIVRLVRVRMTMFMSVMVVWVVFLGGSTTEAFTNIPAPFSVGTWQQHSFLAEEYTAPLSVGTCQKHNRLIAISPVELSRRQAAALALSSSKNDVNIEDEEVFGAPVDEIFPQKLNDGVKFNLFGIGRQDDEDKVHGAFQPPPNSMKGKVIVITGASSGLGQESAKRLALSGATIVLTARTNEKVELSVKAVEDYCLGKSSSYGKSGQYVSGAFTYAEPDIRGIALDLDDLSSVRTFPERYKECMKEEKIHVLMNNAGGGGFSTRQLTADGFERTFQSCHLGQFVLTARLFEEGLLNDEDGCTVINVSSCSHRCSEANYGIRGTGTEVEVEYGYDFDNMNCEVSYSPDLQPYAQGKLANILMTRELQKRAKQKQFDWLTSVSLEPGGVATDIWRNSNLGYDPRTFQDRRNNNNEALEQPKDRTFSQKLTSEIFYRFATQVERGANVQIWLAYVAATRGSSRGAIIYGQHYDETREPIPVPAYAKDANTCTRLWDLSEEMAGIKFL